MPTDRIFRYTMCGATYLLSSVFFYLLFGGSIGDLQKMVTGINSMVPFIAIFFSTPVVGIMISTLTFVVVYWTWRKGTHRFMPDDKSIVGYILMEYPEIKKQTPRNKPISKWGRKKRDWFYLYYQSQVREHIKNDHMAFLERRWQAFWIHCNALASVVISFLIMYASVLSSDIVLVLDFCTPKVIGLICLAVYITVAIVQLLSAKNHACTYEHIWLSNQIRKSKDSNNNALTQIRPWIYYQENRGS